MQRKIPELLLDEGSCYAAMQAHDTRFDGRFYCGVSSTRIYCRPICRVKLPRKENCTFFISAAAAEAAGYRNFGVRKALLNRSSQEILALSQKWSPWRSYATILLWNSLSRNIKIQKGRYCA